nr:uncharacterized protein LOC119179022 [Rhipicephalus microplus]
MRLYLLHALLIYVFKFASSDSQEMDLESSLCAVNSSLVNTCVNTTWNPRICTGVSGSGILCLNRTINPELCIEGSRLGDMECEGSVLAPPVVQSREKAPFAMAPPRSAGPFEDAS